ncbi:SGNH/GDSL hydrolase family protein [Sulfitobacter sp. PR48]|uniref:SGNH/GDSL hydrolase family protein n=1 Tax=Sulfitobacter sp. PR48 TaxID=3028383 RepID=UPI00237B98C7|nr:SGNH/GDSL hydrolase family protein [Sulfitobacter sp. PR48]MDD9720518.1 SGNH/GDSL hydrolase family protein [Sulfitobacter sp. PR48]
MRTFSQATATLLTMSLATPALAESWTPAWMASPQAVWRDTSVFETGLPDGIAGATIRQPLTLGYGAAHLRLVLSNLHGTQPLPIDAVSLAQSAGAARAEAPQPVLFGGRPGTFIAPGATFVSDPVHFPAEAGARIAVTLTFGPGAVAEDFHWDARETSYLVDADRPDPAVLSEIPARLTLSAVLSDRPARQVVVAMGDSITDGNGAPMDAMARWPDFLARALSARGIAVVNAGISGARLLSDGMGRSVLARLESDALAVPGADTLVLLIGTNDIAWPGTPFAPEEPPMRLDRLQAGLLQVAARVQAQGMRLILGTVPPFDGALPGTPMETRYWSPEKDALRRALNNWLRGADFHDGLVDFDQLLADRDDDMRLNPAHDSGDHLHPGAEGNRAMADAVAETLLKGLDQ